MNIFVICLQWQFIKATVKSAPLRFTRNWCFPLISSIFDKYVRRSSLFAEAATGGVLWKKVFLKILQNSQENTCASNFIKKETLAQGFFWEFCEVFKNIFSTEHLRWLLLNLEYVLLCNFNKIKLFLCRVMTRIILESIIVSIIINIS